MKPREKLFIKFVRILPFLFCANIVIWIIEILASNKTIISDYLLYFFGYSYLTLIPLLVLSHRMNFCNYHKLPIYFLFASLFFTQIFEDRAFGNVFLFFNYSILLATFATFALSFYLYKHKNPMKR